MDLVNLIVSCAVLIAITILWIEVKHVQHTQQHNVELLDNKLTIAGRKLCTQMKLLKVYCQDIRLHGENQNGSRVITLLKCAEADLKGEINNFDPEGYHPARQTLKEIDEFFAQKE